MIKYVTSPEFREKIDKHNTTLEIVKQHGNNSLKFRDFIFANSVSGFIHSLVRNKNSTFLTITKFENHC